MTCQFSNAIVRRLSGSRSRYALKTTEFEIAARAIARLGFQEAAFTAGERPDWTVELDGMTIGAEVVEVNPSALFTNRIADLNIALREAADADPSLPINGRYLGFTFGALAFNEGRELTAGVRRALLRELLAYLRAGAFETGYINGYATLETYKIIHADKFAPGHQSIELPPTTFSPTGPLSTVFAHIERKVERARGYDKQYPLWLILSITEMMGVFSETLVRFCQAQLADGPFPRVILSDGITVQALPH